MVWPPEAAHVADCALPTEGKVVTDFLYCALLSKLGQCVHSVQIWGRPTCGPRAACSPGRL